MNDKTKRIILITACCLLCGVAVIGIAGRFGGNTVTPSGTVSGSQPDSNDPNVNINNSQGDVNVPSLTPEQSDPGQGANSNGTEQTIQANPVKPDAPEKPESPSGTATLPDDHKAEDVPTSERKTEDEPHCPYYAPSVELFRSPILYRTLNPARNTPQKLLFAYVQLYYNPSSIFQSFFEHL